MTRFSNRSVPNYFRTRRLNFSEISSYLSSTNPHCSPEIDHSHKTLIQVAHHARIPRALSPLLTRWALLQCASLSSPLLANCALAALSLHLPEQIDSILRADRCFAGGTSRETAYAHDDLSFQAGLG